jgi:hypothetical protein
VTEYISKISKNYLARNIFVSEGFKSRAARMWEKRNAYRILVGKPE